jgi:hypothetical protein
VALSLTGTVRDPFFSTRPDGVQAISFQLECGKSFRVCSVDGEDRRETVYPLDGSSLAPGADAANVASLHNNGAFGYLDPRGGTFYTEGFLEAAGNSFLGNGTRAAEALALIATARRMCGVDALQFPTRLRVVAYGSLAQHTARMASDGTEVNLTGFGRTWKPRRPKNNKAKKPPPRRFEVVAVYVHFVRGVDWPDGKPDLVRQNGTGALPGRLAPVANITGLVVEHPYFIEGGNGRDDFLSLVVSAGWKPDVDALVVLHAHGARARELKDRVSWFDMIQAECAVTVRKNRRLPLVRFAVRDLAVLGHREVG